MFHLERQWKMEGVLAIVNSVEELMLAYTAICACLEKISDKREERWTLGTNEIGYDG